LSFELARRGFEVVGVDLSSRMIEVAQGKLQTWPATRETAPPRFVQGDLSEFELGEAFDSATCLYDSLNYILDPQKLQAAFARIAHHVKPGGVFVFDMNSEYALTADLSRSAISIHASNCTTTGEHNLMKKLASAQ
jgi:SAM-dependent methyltransferase